MFKTYQTKIHNQQIQLLNESSIPLYDYFNRYAQRFGILERKLFVDLYIYKKPSNSLKTFYCKKYNLTSRQYNSIKKQLDGRVSSIQELRLVYIEDIQVKIEKTKSVIKRKIEQKEKQHQALLNMNGNEKNFLKKVNKYRKLRQYIHQQKRKLHSFILKLENLNKDKENNVIRLCFGSKVLFHKQFHLEENHLTFQEWKKKWQEARSAQFTFIGSKDEIFGNQTCTYDLQNNIRIRMDKKDEDLLGKYITIPNVTFAYGQEQIDRAKIPTVGYTKGKRNKVNYYRALTCKFIHKDKQWYLNISVDVDAAEIKTLQGNGSIGIDFNAQFLAVTEVDRFGNYLCSFQVPFCAYHVSSKQAEQSLSCALKVVVEYALEKQKPIVYENLDFKKKKQQIKQMSKKQANLLSGFAYSSYKKMLVSKCEKSGVKTIMINPAYTSQIGHHKFMKKYGLSSHESAAMIIARKAMNFKRIEKVPVKNILQEKKSILQKKRLNQWKEVTNQWKKYTFGQKNYLLYKVF
jgi:IS605 OrfB family transposase